MDTIFEKYGKFCTIYVLNSFFVAGFLLKLACCKKLYIFTIWYINVADFVSELK